MDHKDRERDVRGRAAWLRWDGRGPVLPPEIGEPLVMWTILKCAPLPDHPDHWTVRRTLVFPELLLTVLPSAVVLSGIEEARACVPAGLFRMDRYPEDPPEVVETWI